MNWQIAATVSFKWAEMFFKYLTWLVLIAAIQYAWVASQKRVLAYVYGAMICAYVWSLMLQLMHVFTRDPRSYGVPDAYVAPVKALEVVFSTGAFLLLALPPFALDEVIAAIIAART